VTAPAFKTTRPPAPIIDAMRSYLSLVLVMALWGSAFASSKLAVQEVPHEVAAFVRFALAALILLPLRRLDRQRLSVREIATAAGLGVIGVFGYNLFFFLALSLAPSADGTVIVPVIAPVITVAVTAVVGRRRLATRTVVGLATAVAGAAVFFVGIPAGGSNRVAGDLLFLAGAACWAGYTILGAPVLCRLPALSVTGYATAAGALILGVVAVPKLDAVEWSGLDAGFWLNQAYLVILPTALAYVLYYRSVRSVGPAMASSAMFLVPVFGLACSWVLVGESITAVQAGGSGLMMVGAWLATLTPERAASIRSVWRRSLRTSHGSTVVTGSAPSEPCRTSVPSSGSSS
jgi:drug/metabolite transporter (DMT)-like permease